MGLQMTKIPAVGFEVLSSPSQKATPRGAEYNPSSRARQGLVKQHSLMKHSPRTRCRVSLVLYLPTGSKKKSKAATNPLRRVRSKKTADFKGYESVAP